MPDDAPPAEQPFPTPAPKPRGVRGRCVRLSFGAKAARLSWQLPIWAVVANFFLNGAHAGQMFFAAALLLSLSVIGVEAAVAALISMARFGWKRILVPACIGLLLNSLILWRTLVWLL